MFKNEKILTEYRVCGLLGEGAFSKVKLGVHKKTGEKVAIKIISKEKLLKNYQRKEMEKKQRAQKKKKNSVRPVNNNANLSELYLDPAKEQERINDNQRKKEKEAEVLEQMPGTFSNGLAKEVRLLRTLKHPNIIQLYEVVETLDNYFIIMQYAGGGELVDSISKSDKFSENEARKIFRDIVSAMSYCHQSGVLHRDLKLENILLSNDHQVLISDFGLGRTYETETQCGTFCGTPLYAAPELISGIRYQGPAADIWAMGVVLYTMVNGKPPFQANALSELYRKIKKAEFENPPHTSEGLRNLLRKILVNNPKKRISMENLVKDPWLNAGFDSLPEYTPPITKGIERLGDCKSIDFDNKMIKFSFSDHLKEVEMQQQQQYLAEKRKRKTSLGAGSSANSNGTNNVLKLVPNVKRSNTSYHPSRKSKSSDAPAGSSADNNYDKSVTKDKDKVDVPTTLANDSRGTDANLRHSFSIGSDQGYNNTTDGSSCDSWNFPTIKRSWSRDITDYVTRKKTTALSSSSSGGRLGNGSGFLSEYVKDETPVIDLRPDPLPRRVCSQSDITYVRNKLKTDISDFKNNESVAAILIEASNAESQNKVMRRSSVSELVARRKALIATYHEDIYEAQPADISNICYRKSNGAEDGFNTSGPLDGESVDDNPNGTNGNKAIDKNSLEMSGDLELETTTVDYGKKATHDIETIRNVKGILRLARFSSKCSPQDMGLEILRVLTLLNMSYQQMNGFCWVVKHQSTEEEVEFEIEIVKVFLLSVYGVRMKRVHGSSWLYKQLHTNIRNNITFTEV